MSLPDALTEDGSDFIASARPRAYVPLDLAIPRPFGVFGPFKPGKIRLSTLQSNDEGKAHLLKAVEVA